LSFYEKEPILNYKIKRRKIIMTIYTNAAGTTFNIHDAGKGGQYNRYIGWYNPFEGELGETFKVVLIAHTKREHREKMEARA